MHLFLRETKLTKDGIGDVWVHSWRLTGKVRSVCYHPDDSSRHWILRGSGLECVEELFDAGDKDDLILRLRAAGARLEP
jgi:hypothetical protein